jgi:hypothetical protein
VAKVYFGTNRKPNRKKAPDDFGSGFSEDGLATLRFGMAEVSGDDLEKFDLYLAPEKLKVDYDLKVKGASGSVLGSKNVFSRVRDKMLHHQRDTVVSGVVQHSYFLDCPKVIDDMKQVLIGIASDAIPGRHYVHETNRYRMK